MQLQSVVARSSESALNYKNMGQSQLTQQTDTSAGPSQRGMQSASIQMPNISNSNEKNVNLDEEAKKIQVENTVETINKFLEPTQTSIQFKLHEKTDAYFVQVINRDNGEVIREIPSEQMLDLRYAFEKYLGILVDEKI